MLLICFVFVVESVKAAEWPPLPKEGGFVRGRLTTLADVGSGSALGAPITNGTRKPLPMLIPQYVYFHKEDGSKVPGILIHAELLEWPTGQSMKVAGVRFFDGKGSIVSVESLEFLGTKPLNR